MPQVQSRSKLEDEVSAAMAAILSRHRNQLGSGAYVPTFASEMSAALTEPLKTAFTTNAYQTMAGLNIGVGNVSSAADAWATSYSQALAGMVDRQVSARFSGRIIQPDDTDKQLAMLATPARWSTLAATEITRAGTAGSEYAAAAWITLRGILVTTSWHTVEGACPYCAPLDGLVREVYERFVPDGPPAHPNCRCWLDYNHVGRN